MTDKATLPRHRGAEHECIIGGELWSEVEWSPQRRAWCVQDACGHCLAHCEHIHGVRIDQRTAVALAKAMIRDGRMPSPEQAQRQLKERQVVQAGQGVPMPMLKQDDDSPLRIPVDRD